MLIGNANKCIWHVISEVDLLHVMNIFFFFNMCCSLNSELSVSFDREEMIIMNLLEQLEDNKDLSQKIEVLL